MERATRYQLRSTAEYNEDLFRCDDLPKLRMKLPVLANEIMNKDKFRELYLFTFDFAKTPGQKALGEFTGRCMISSLDRFKLIAGSGSDNKRKVLGCWFHVAASGHLSEASRNKSLSLYCKFRNKSSGKAIFRGSVQLVCS